VGSFRPDAFARRVHFIVFFTGHAAFFFALNLAQRARCAAAILALAAAESVLFVGDLLRDSVAVYAFKGRNRAIQAVTFRN
jgi:hypothetical protein